MTHNPNQFDLIGTARQVPSLRDDIRDTVSPHKFGGSRMATMLYLLSLDQGQDAETGDSDFGWFARFGRKILESDSNGFIYAHRFATEAEAVSLFERIEALYNTDEEEGI